MTDARPRDWRAVAKLAADMRRNGPTRPAVVVPVGQAKLAREAEAQVEASRVLAATAAREVAYAAEVKAEADKAAAATPVATPAKSRPWYATGESKAGPKRWDMATGKATPTTLSRYVRLNADLTDAEAAMAAKGGTSLQALIKLYGVAASEWTTGVPT